MEEIEKFKKELNELVEKFDARLYIEQNHIQNSSELFIDFPKSSFNTIFSDGENIDYLFDKEQCTECGQVLNSENEIESVLCQSCLNEATRNDISFQEGITECWNYR